MGTVSVQRGAVPAARASAAVPSIAIVPFAGDVFTIGTNGSLITVDPRSTATAAPLFNLEGNPLNVTWGSWSSASATATADENKSVKHPDTTVRVHMTSLIPHGVYSLFYRTFTPDTNNPLCPNVEPSLALHSIDAHQRPDASSFVADGRGEAHFTGRAAGHLLDAQQVQYSVIYHFDGHTYGDLANEAESASQPLAAGATCRSSYGIDAMRQFLIIQK